jgi:predicted phage terminase large subunit-like protein
MDKENQGLPTKIDTDILKRLFSDRKVMIATTRLKFFYFFYIYFGRYIKYPIAPFHLEMINAAQDESIKRVVVMSFRDSAKSTILNTAYTLWAIMGNPQKKHVVIASQSQQRAKDHLMNIRKEIENNQLLSENLGPFQETEDRWHASTLIIPHYGARITAISTEEGIRGLREGPYRPDLIIADDIEDSNSVKTREGRDKTFNWFTGELLPMGEIDTKVIVLGNFLHQDSVISRLEELIKTEKMKGVVLRVPLVDENNNIAWPGKFSSLEAVEELKQSIGNEITWQRDFLLQAVPDDYQIIHPEWIQYYDELPSEEHRYLKIGVDMATTKNYSSDYTAMVAGKVYDYDKNLRIYILPNPVNERLYFTEIVDRCKLLQSSFGKGDYPEFLVEEVGCQNALTDTLFKEGILAKGVKINGQDKGTRLALTSPSIQSGRVLFPRKGAERLIEQLKGFGLERHDDLVDAFTLLVLEAISDRQGPVRFHWL